ncbi:MAG: hypothetical protein ACI8ZX_001354, partial [Planctomycetota bacterium]
KFRTKPSSNYFLSSKRLKKYFEPDKLTKKKVNLYQYNTKTNLNTLKQVKRNLLRNVFKIL